MSNPIYLSPSIASKLFGISERSIRRAIKNNELPVLIQQARYKIDLKDILSWAEKMPNRIAKRDELGIGQFVEEWRNLA